MRRSRAKIAYVRVVRRIRWLDVTIGLLLIGMAAWIAWCLVLGISVLRSPTDQQGEPLGVGDRIGIGLTIALLVGPIPAFFVGWFVVWLWQKRQVRRHGWVPYGD
jgi:hypothetical protein